jgi:regulator of protease activity HflC (stomatin/prohibitin superfamily)
MFGFSYLKSDPTDYVIHYSGGKLAREGQGLAFFCFLPNSVIMAVPTASRDVPFIFNEVTADYQQVSLQGQITYRICDAKKMAQQLNFTINPATRRHLSEDPEKLGQRVINLAQVLTRPEVQRLPLKTALVSTADIMAGAVKAIKSSEAFLALGVEVLSFNLLAIKPTPEMAKAIEAEAREELQKRADEAISARRNAAVEQERRIKENELRTEMIVQEKRQELERAALESHINLEKQRQQFIDARVENSRKEADAQAYTLAATLKPLAALDPKVMQALACTRMDPPALIALAMRDLAQDAGKIGQLNITPDLLTSLLQSTPRKADKPGAPPARA